MSPWIDGAAIKNGSLKLTALQDKTTVPKGYDLMLLNADNVSNGKDLIEASEPEVVEVVAEDIGHVALK